MYTPGSLVSRICRWRQHPQFEHYEIAAYGTATFARRMWNEAVAQLLDHTLAEEKHADYTLRGNRAYVTGSEYHFARWQNSRPWSVP